jgi:hypothetical protein
MKLLASIQKLSDCRDVLNELSVDLSLKPHRKQSFKSLKFSRHGIDSTRKTSRSQSREKGRYDRTDKNDKETSNKKVEERTRNTDQAMKLVSDFRIKSTSLLKVPRGGTSRGPVVGKSNTSVHPSTLISSNQASLD